MKSSCRIMFVAGVLVASSMLLGCATLQVPTSAGVLLPGSPDVTAMKTNRYVAMCDAVVSQYSSFGKDPINLDLSMTVAHLTVEAVKRHLQTNGYRVIDAVVPILGGFYTRTNLFSVSGSDISPGKQLSPPFYTAGHIAADPEYDGAIRDLSLGVWTAFSWARDAKPFQYFTAQAVKETTIKVLADRTHADAIVVVLQNGVRVGAGTIVGQEVAGSVAVAVLSLGTMSGTVGHKTSALDSYIAIVDLHTGAISWANSRRFTRGRSMFEKDYYLSDWPHYMLYHVPGMTHAH